MNNLFLTEYERNRASVTTDNLGMREMQRRVYEKSSAQYLLVKAPPASGKSRALMFVALEKLKNHQVNKVIVAVPDRSIAKSFAPTDLMTHGFHSNWSISRRYDLCTPGVDSRKTEIFMSFIESQEEDAKILLCTHSTLRFSFERLGAAAFNNTLLAVDEFHHVSTDVDNKLGELIRAVMNNSNANIVAMTGSYFRGDCVEVLSPHEEERFVKVTYNYYEQLNGYQYLKSLGIGFHFYNGPYYNALSDTDVLDINRKTIIYIPNVNSSESTKDKYEEVDRILESIGSFEFTDDNGLYHVKTASGKELIIADLVDDRNAEVRSTILSYLRNVSSPEDVDIILALAMAKEGFDWPYCESTLTIGYRGSLTEIVQIIGRCTRDSFNKTHAQFTNLVAEPSANREEVVESVNNILKAITASLLMEEVIAPKFNYRPKNDGTENESDGKTFYVKGFRGISSEKVQEIIDNDIVDLKASILQDADVQKAIPVPQLAETINKGLIPKIVRDKYPSLNEDEVEQLSQYVVIDNVLGNKKVQEIGGRRIIEFASRLINVDELNIDLISSINPFQDAYEIMSKSLDSRVFKAIQTYITALKVNVTDDEAIALWPKIQEFYVKTGKKPSLDALDPYEKRLAEVLVYIQNVKRNG